LTRFPSGSAAVLAILIALGSAPHDTAFAADPATTAPTGATLDSVATHDTLPRLAPKAQGLSGSGLLREDRLRHLSLSFALALGAGLASDSPAAAAGIAGGIGLLKEIDDGRRGPGFDGWDLLADLLGAGLAAWAIAALDP